MATWASDHPNIVSMSLRNELRESWNDTDLYYNWQTLVGNMTAGCDAIHEANPDSEFYFIFTLCELAMCLSGKVSLALS